MKMVLIGHRGVGKSQLLKRMKFYHQLVHPDISYFDLDQEISARQGKSISQVFDECGEAQFRQLERQVFQELTNEHKN